MMEPQLAPAAQDVGKGAMPAADQALDLGDGAAILRKTLPQGLQQLLFRLGARRPRGSFLLHGPALWSAGAGRKLCLGVPPEPWSPAGPAASISASSIFRNRVQEEPGSMRAVEKIRRHESDRSDRILATFLLHPPCFRRVRVLVPFAAAAAGGRIRPVREGMAAARRRQRPVADAGWRHGAGRRRGVRGAAGAELGGAVPRCGRDAPFRFRGPDRGKGAEDP